MTNLPLFRVRSWNNGLCWMSLYILMVIFQQSRHLITYPSGVGVTKPTSSILSFSQFFTIVKTLVTSWISRSYLTGVTTADTRQIWKWFKEPDMYYFTKSKHLWTEKLSNGTLVLVTPIPRVPWCVCYKLKIWSMYSPHQHIELASISQVPFSSTFSWMKICEFRFTEVCS